MKRDGGFNFSIGVGFCLTADPHYRAGVDGPMSMETHLSKYKPIYSKCNRESVEFIIASDRVGKIRGLGDAIDYALTEYPWPDDAEKGPIFSIHMLAKPHSDGTPGKIEVRHKFEEPDCAIPTFTLMHIDARGFNIKAPLWPLLTDDNLDGSYTVYEHQIADYSGVEAKYRSYVGITKCGWAARWRQHVCSANNGSPYLFHDAIRQMHPRCVMRHSVHGCGLSYEAAMKLEEEIVAELSLFPRGLNMIPGGFAGIRFLGQRGFHGVTEKTWEHRSKLVREFRNHCERNRLPDPLLSARLSSVWKSDDYAASVICSNPNNFDLERVREARLLASFDWTTEQIAERFSCKPARVDRLIRGDTYARVH